jgi:PIN domain nuclease of toxin-antitoxin system
MRILLDSHAFVWAQAAPLNLSEEARALLVDPDNTVFVSVVSAWELWIKHAKKPIPGFGRALDAGAESFVQAALDSAIDLLEVTLDHAWLAARLPDHHRDPFDRMLIAQAMHEQLTLVTHDDAFDRYRGLRVLKT